MTATLLASNHPRAAGRGAVVDVSRPAVSLQWRTVAADGLWIAGIVWSVPLALLIVGTPLALAIVALLWAGRRLFGTF